MAARGNKVLLAMSLAAALCGVSQSDCASVLVPLGPCLDYVTGNSSKPSLPCCTQLGDLVKTQTRCLCEAFYTGGSAFGFKLNKTLVQSLPPACKVQSPPCNATPPASSPPPAVGSPSGNAPSSGRGEGKSYGNSIKLAYSVVVFFVFVATSLTFI